MDRIQEAFEQNIHPSVELLRNIPTFSDLPEDGLQWLASVMVSASIRTGEVVFGMNTPADYLFVIVSGELRGDRGDGRVFYMRAGQVTGLLPYSRLTTFSISVRAEADSQTLILHKRYFPEMLERLPALRERLVNLLSDRIREATKVDQQHEKLIALGKLSAGLAHELNNPAAAVRRAVDSLRQTVNRARTAHREIEKRGLDEDSRLFLADLDCNWLKRVGPAKALDTLDRSDLEEEFTTWLEARRIPDSFSLAATLVDTGFSLDLLEEVASRVPPDLLQFVLQKVSASLCVERLLEEISSSTGRISELIRAIKDYSYMDQSPEQEVDIHDGIENTLLMLRYQLKNGIEVERRYDRSIPRVSLHGSEMNQVWTNLISNSIDAMGGKGKLLITTKGEGREVRVEVIDNGPGIPPEIKSQIFDPFFTTKPLGQGTGLGLDAVYRIVTNHRGRIEVDSRPGETRFSIFLPLVRHALV